MNDESKKTEIQDTPFNPFIFEMGERWGREFGKVEARLSAIDPGRPD